MHQPTAKQAAQPINRLLRINSVIDAMASPKPSIYAAIKRGEMTSPIKIGERASAWLESEVIAINNARIAGKPADEIKMLVLELEAKRLTIGGAA